MQLRGESIIYALWVEDDEIHRHWFDTLSHPLNMLLQMCRDEEYNCMSNQSTFKLKYVINKKYE